MLTTAGHSPWSNGANERNHYTIDLTVEKLLAEENENVKLEDALRLATYSYNNQIRSNGYSPNQIVLEGVQRLELLHFAGG